MRDYKKHIPGEGVAVFHEAMKKSLTEFLVLYFLHQKPMYTYELIQEIGQKSGGHFNYNTLYIAIYRLQEKGYVTEHEKIMTGDNRTRVYFANTPEGDEYLQSCIGEFTATMEVMTGLLERNGELYPTENA